MANDSLAPVSEFTMARRWFIPPTDAPPRFDLITHSVGKFFKQTNNNFLLKKNFLNFYVFR